MAFLKNLVLLLVLIVAATECAEAKTITCNFDFDLKSISFGNVLNKKSINKEFESNGIKFKYHVDNTSDFSDVNDYMTMENAQGHKMTYALSCY